MLLVEDDPVQLRGLAQYLIGRGHAVSAASLVIEASARLLERSYDAAILDVCVPDATGVAVLHAIRAMPGFERMPVVITSGLPASDLKALADLPNVAVLQKPFDLYAVEAAILVAKGGAR